MVASECHFVKTKLIAELDRKKRLDGKFACIIVINLLLTFFHTIQTLPHC